MAHNLSEQQIQMYKEVFAIFDKGDFLKFYPKIFISIFGKKLVNWFDRKSVLIRAIL